MPSLPAGSSKGVLLDTIIVPRDLKQLPKHLPPPSYDTDRVAQSAAATAAPVAVVPPAPAPAPSGPPGGQRAVSWSSGAPAPSVASRPSSAASQFSAGRAAGKAPPSQQGAVHETDVGWDASGWCGVDILPLCLFATAGDRLAALLSSCCRLQAIITGKQPGAVAGRPLHLGQPER